MSPNNEEILSKPDLFDLALPALIRAQKKAYERTRQCGGTVCIWKDGKIAEVDPTTLLDDHPQP
ncbi:MAG: hypothetical protein HQL07_11830 [Nitrospirae bacterium]|nr:hypothetical protein [Magnetococcales bacterium]HAT49530.1 hypothetical protein [Alphaproteobacteria bacterium]